MWWIVGLLISVALMVVSYMLMPKPKGGDPIEADQFDDNDFPIAEESAPIPVPFGDVWMKNGNVVWWGDVKTTEIWKKPES